MAYNVLIVDDSSVVRKSLIKTFGMTDLPIGNFYQAENGQVGLDLLRLHWIDIILLDINMPIMNGMEFMDNLVKDEHYSATPVVVFSTEGSKERIDELTKHGVRAYLRKPASPESLVETITSILGVTDHE
jgi:two-component system, chemotaxis family, chemotaxis protein CheY